MQGLYCPTARSALGDSNEVLVARDASIKRITVQSLRSVTFCIRFPGKPTPQRQYEQFWDVVLLIASTFFFVAYLMVLFHVVVDLFEDSELAAFIHHCRSLYRHSA